MISSRTFAFFAALTMLGGCSERPISAIRYPSVAFVVMCRFSHELADDPIVHPGVAGASHQHSFFGNATTFAGSTPETMAGASTTCSDPLDTGAYWAPSPAANSLRAYYDRGTVDPERIEAPPAGLKMIAGNPLATQPVGVDIVAFRCGVVADGPHRGVWLEQPPETCAGGAVPVVRYTFAQCADECSDQSVRFARLRLVMDWVGPASMRIAPHADFWNTWNQARLEELTAICIRGERSTNLAIKVCGLPGAT